MSDDGWFGEPQEPASGSAYGQGRRAARGRPPQAGQPGQSGEYAQAGQQYAQPDPYAQSGQYPQSGQYAQQYPQDPYQSNQYPQDYPAQPESSYYDELGPRSFDGDTGQDWNTGQVPNTGQPGNSGPGASTGQFASTGQDWNSGNQGYATPTPQAYPQQSQPSQPSYPSRGQQQPAQPRPAAPADPYASGFHATGSYASDPYASGSHASDPYASGSHASGAYGSGSYAPDAYASDAYTAPTPTDPYAAERYTSPTDPYGSGSYGRPSRGDTNGGAGYRPVPNPQGQPQDPYGRRRTAGAAGTSTTAPGAEGGYGAGPGPGYTQYPDDDEFPSRSSRRPAPGYATEADRYGAQPGGGRPGPDADRRAESPSAGRSRRRAVLPDDGGDHGDGGDRFSLIDEDDDDGDAGSGRGRKPKSQKRGRNCLAVFIAFSVIAGGLGYGGYKGVQWYQSKYGPAPDYVSAVGTGAKVPINIPSGSGGKTIGGLLFNAGIVKSQRAFTDACNSNAQCANIQAGTYLIPQGISASAAVTDLLDPKNKDSKSQLITYGGERAAQIFAALESKTGWKDADIRTAIASGKIDLPAWDTGQPGAKFPYAHIEGFMAAESYTLTDYKTPTDLLKKMVDDQLSVFSQEDMANKASKLGLTEYKMLIIASLARAEAGSNVNDLNKIAGVVFNRFNNPMQFAHLGFDTATLYGMGNTGTVPDNKDTANPYNTSVLGIKGLPPSPIDNPDQPSIDAALNPNRANNYFYFCATPDGVQYASSNTQWQELGTKYPGLCGSK